MVSNTPVTLPDERGRFGEFGGKFVPETLMAALAEQPASGGWTRWEVIVEEFVPSRIKHRAKNSTSTQQPEMSLIATETALLPKVSYMARPTVF
jgi:hypothetical protein